MTIFFLKPVLNLPMLRWNINVDNADHSLKMYLEKHFRKYKEKIIKKYSPPKALLLKMCHAMDQYSHKTLFSNYSFFFHFRYCICSSLYHLSTFFPSTFISAAYQNIWNKRWFCSNLWSNSYSRWRKENSYKEKWWWKNQGVWIFLEKG